MSATPITPPAARPTFIDLFCGCGGFTLGLQRAGFKPVGFGHRERGVKLEFSFSRASPCCSSYPSRPHRARPPSSSSS